MRPLGVLNYQVKCSHAVQCPKSLSNWAITRSELALIARSFTCMRMSVLTGITWHNSQKIRITQCTDCVLCTASCRSPERSYYDLFNHWGLEQQFTDHRTRSSLTDQTMNFDLYIQLRGAHIILPSLTQIPGYAHGNVIVVCFTTACRDRGISGCMLTK